MREPSDRDFFVEVEGIGTFRFARRTYGDRLKIRSEFLKLVGDIGESDEDLAAQAAIIASHQVLCVEAPEGWEDLSAVDMVEIPDAEEKIFSIYIALKEKEDSFRGSADKKSEAAGP